MARPFRIGARWSELFEQPGPINPTRRRDVPLSMCGWRDPVDDVLQRHGTSSQAEPASTPEAIEDQLRSGGPSEKYQCSGAVVGTPRINRQLGYSPSGKSADLLTSAHCSASAARSPDDL
jgi:hypothetical protein